MLIAVQLFRTLDEVTSADRPRIGGKSYNCARLRQAGLPVPDGIVIPSDASEEDIRALPEHPWLDSIPAGTLFAVRSSGLGEDSEGHSFAGIHETHLNVAREQIVEAVLVCRRSASSEPAVAYRKARGLDADGIGVLVQCMVQAVTSGVAFTIDPITGADEIVINQAPGLGEALVSGLIEPDEYILRKSDLSIVSARKVSDTSDTTLSELGRMLLRIEQLYGAPQDVEWCHDGRKYWIVQSRPVTSKLGTQNFERRTTFEPEWTRANVAEVLPDQLSPQAMSVYVDMLNKAERQFMGKLFASDEELGPILNVFHGRIYFNLSQLRRVCAMFGVASADLLKSFGHPEEIRQEDHVPAGMPLIDRIRALPDVIRMAIGDLRAGSVLRQHEARTARSIARLTAVDPASLTDRQIQDEFQWWIDIAPESIQIVFLMSAVLMREQFVRRVCDQVGFPYERLVYPQLAAGERSVSTQQAVDLVALADVARQDAVAKSYLLIDDGTFTDFRTSLAGTMFLDRFDRFLEKYGHRGHYESDWALPRLRENPSPALFAIREQLQAARPQDQKAIAERQEADAAAAWRAFAATMTPAQRWILLPVVRSTIRRLKQQYVWREQVRSDLTRVLGHMRPYLLVLANRFVERGWIDRRDDFFLLHVDEIARVIDDPRQAPELRDIARRRAAERAAERDLQLPLLMRESELPKLMARRSTSASPSADGNELTGLCVSPGSVEAEVVVMRDPGGFAAMKRGAILVAPATDPSWTPLFTLASGVIVEVGGMLSHASTIAREYGLPALANVKNATRSLKTGDRVRLDASGGIVRRI